MDGWASQKYSPARTICGLVMLGGRDDAEGDVQVEAEMRDKPEPEVGRGRFEQVGLMVIDSGDGHWEPLATRNGGPIV